MEQIEAFINSRMTDMSFQPKNNNTLPKQIKQSNFYSTASTTPTDIMDVSKAYCWTYYYYYFFYKIDLKRKKILSFFVIGQIIPSIVSTKLVWFFIFTLIVISQKIHTEKKIVYFHLYPPPPQKTLKKNQLHIVPQHPSKFQIWKFLVFFQNCLYYYYIIKMCYCTWRKKNAVKIQNFEFWNKRQQHIALLLNIL